MQAIAAFPEELILVIFNKLSVKQLATCRLVCKAWRDPAARAMFSQRITIRSEMQALQLYNHLTRDPNKLYLINNMHFNLDQADPPFIIHHLLHLTFNERIKRMTGRVKSDQFFTTLFDIADRAPPSTFDRLERLPIYTGQNSDINDRKYLKFKNAVHSFSLRVVSDSQSLDGVSWKDVFDQFPNLTRFTLSGAPNGLGAIENKLEKCHRLKELYLHDIFYGGLTMDRMTREQMMAWMANNVNRERSLRTLIVKALCRPELIEYLLYKYPHVQYVTIKGRLWFPNNSIRLEHYSLNRILDAVKKIRHKHITFVLPSYIEMKQVIEFVITRNEDIGFTIEHFDGHDEVVMKIDSH